MSENQYGGATASQAQDAATSLLQSLTVAEGLSVQGIYCPNQTTTYGMLQALQGKSLAGKVKFVGFDSGETLNAGLKQERCNALLDILCLS